MLTKIKSFFMKLIPTKRRLIQLYAALLHNAYIKGFVKGEIFDGVTKHICAPGLNCYSCPGAIGACPLGSLQNALAESKTKVPTYIIGIILLYSIILGRTICGFLCPVGLLQELLYKIRTPKLKKNKITRILSYFKYVLLGVLVIGIPLIYGLQAKNIPLPGFCKYICPAGTFEGAIFLLSNPNNTDFFSMLGHLFTWKFCLLIIFVVSSVFIYRFFCRFFCPLGAIYGLFNKLAILGVKVDDSKCDHCNVCISNCKMDVKKVGDHECIQCGECMKGCHNNAIKWKAIREKIKKEIELEKLALEQEDTKVELEDNKKIVKTNKKKIITTIILLLVLITTFIFVNFNKKVYQINDTCAEFKVELIDGTSYDITKSNNPTLVYFFNEITNEKIEQIKKYANDSLDIILIAKYELDINSIIDTNQINELKEFNIKVAKDIEKNKYQKLFNDEDLTNYSIFLDKTDKILLKTENLITPNDYSGLVMPIILGKTIGNKVGDICYNKEITLIGSNETFSVFENKGKITVINFWFTSCTPCVQELPHFNSLYEEYSDYMTVIAIHNASLYEGNPTGVKEFVDNQFKDYSILFGYDTVKNDYYTMLGGKSAWPTTIIVDQDGIISFVKHGSLSEEDLRIEIEKLIKK